MKNIILLLLIGILMISCSSVQKKKFPSKDNFLFPFSQIIPDNKVDDLAFLDKELSNKKFIGLGEATHGTREIYQFKTRLVQYLALKHGAKTLVIEANMADCYMINKYILTGIGQPDELIRDLGIPSMNTLEYVNLIKWLKEYNETQPANNKIRLWGYDVQEPQGALERAITYINKLGIEPDRGLEENLNSVTGSGETIFTVLPDSVAPFLSYSTKFLEFFNNTKDEITRLSDPWEYLFHYKLVESACQSFRLLSIPDMMEAYFSRDKYAYENITWIADQDNTTPVIVWAHNAHILKKDLFYEQFVTIGNHFDNNIPDEYYAIGSVFSEGEVRAIEDTRKPKYVNIALPPASPESADFFFAKEEAENYFLFVNHALSDSRWENILNDTTVIRNIGAAYEPDTPGRNYRKTIFAEQYDAVFFIKKGSAPELND